jgi:8-oxo-dGTP pyrophosphatase MutT (NUDIX family)
MSPEPFSSGMGLFWLTLRSADMSMPLKWEFPGGKIDPGERLRFEQEEKTWTNL